MLGKKLLGGDKKKDKDDSNNNKNKKDLEARVEQLQKSLRERDNTIAELKDKNTRQEKKIDDHTRARLVKEKDATILELKERIRKKDDQTMARLAHPNSPVAKNVLDATLQENRDLHLRIEAMLLQIQDERTLSKECIVLVDTLKRDLATSESKNASLERELQSAKAEMAKLQLQLGLKESPSKPASLSNSNSSASSASTTPTKTSLPSSPRGDTPTTQTPTPSTPIPIPIQPSSTHNDTTSTPTITSTSSTPTKDNYNHGFGDSTLSSDSSISEADTIYATTSLSPRDELAGLETSLESYDDLSKLAKELDTDTLDGGSSLNDLMISLDSVSPAKALDFASLAHVTDTNEFATSLVSPTAHVEKRAPFHTDSEYDKDFISMFSPSSSNNYNQLKVRVRHDSPALNNLFYSEESSSSPPSFNLEGIDGDYLATNHDSLSTSPPHSPMGIEPTTSIPIQWEKASSPSPSPSLSPVQSPTGQVPAPFPISRSRSTSPQQQEEAPSRGKGTHKSIFSVFGNDETNGAEPAQQAATTVTTTSTGHEELMIGFGSKVDTNKLGLRRAKKVNLAAFSSKGKAKVEPTMEDVHFCIYPYLKTKSKALFAVFDGHAGRAAADEASALFPKEFANQLESCSHDVNQAFMKTYASVDQSMKEFEYMGTTATVVYLWQKAGHKFLQASNVGDSTAFLCRNGTSVRLTFDHKPSAAEEKERMRLSGIEVSDNQTRINGLAVSRSLGNHFVKEQNIGMVSTPYVGDCIEILPTDTYLVVASDGLWDVVSSQHAMDIIQGMEALQAAGLLLSTALASTKCNDNVSIIVVRLN